MYINNTLVLAFWSFLANGNPVVRDKHHGVAYHGLNRNGIEVFLNIPYGQDTGGVHRFKPPRLHVPQPNSSVDATAYGPACPQALGPWYAPISLTSITNISENCLNLNIARPRHTHADAKLPVLVFVHGGSYWSGSNEEITIRPDGMIVESVKNGLPVIHVAMNYRLGAFGFAQSEALRAEGSENAGLRDQWLALEWVRDNIAHFGGDPDRVTIFGQSSGGLSMGLLMMAYGGTRPVPFRQVIAESQALEPGITGNFTRTAMQLVADRVGCDKAALQSAETAQCLRDLPLDVLLNASLATFSSDVAHNIGDIWLPSVDGDFLPAPPSQLLRERRFAANITAMMGWCSDDVAFFTDPAIATNDDAQRFLQAYAPGMTPDAIRRLLALYPASDFAPPPGSAAANNLTAQFHRTARVFRDIFMTCEPILYAEHLAAAGSTVYLYEWNQTILDPFLRDVSHRPGLGPIHTSEFAYIFGNLSNYNTGTWAFQPGPADYQLKERASRSWSTFASTGRPSLAGHNTFHNFGPAPGPDSQINIFVAGGPNEGLSPIDGPGAHPAVESQRLRERCALINSPEYIEQLGF